MIDSNVLVAYLASGLTNFGLDFFQKQISVPSWPTFMQINKRVPWQSFLERPENIFNSQFIDQKLLKLPIRKQAMVTRALNKLSILYKGILANLLRSYLKAKSSRSLATSI